MNKIFIFILFIIAKGITQEINAQQTLNYNSFVKHVIDNNPIAERASNFNEYALKQYQAAKGNFDPQLSSFYESKFFDNKNYFSTGEISLKQPIYTSHFLNAGYAYGQGMFLNPENLTSMYGTPFIGIEANLLQGLFFDKRRADLIKAKNYVDFYNIETTIQLNDLLLSSVTTYLNYLYSKELNKVYNYFEDLAAQRYKGVENLSIIGERPAIDTIEAAIFLQSRVIDKQSSELELIKQNNFLAVYYQSKSLNNVQFSISDSIQYIYASCKKSIILANESPTSNPKVAQLLAKQNIIDTEARLKKEMIKPVLKMNYNIVLDRENPPVLLTDNLNNYKWGASFSLPLFLRQSRNEYKMANILSDNNKMETLNEQNEIALKKKYTSESLTTTLAQIVNAEKVVANSKILVEAEKIKFFNGESSLFILNSREQKWLESEIKLLECKLKFTTLYMQLIYLNGDLSYELKM